MSDTFDHGLEAFHRMENGEGDWEDCDGNSSIVSCKFCGETGLHWDQPTFYSGKRWRLVTNDGVVHTCNEAKEFYNKKREKQRLSRFLN